MKTFLILLLSMFASKFSFAAGDIVYQVSYYAKDKNADFVQEQLNGWGAVDLGPAAYYAPNLGSKYFYFQLDQDLVTDLFEDLAANGELYIERTPSPTKVPDKKVRVVLWYFPDRGSPGANPQFFWFKGSSKPGQRRDQIDRSLGNLKIQNQGLSAWKNTTGFSVKTNQLAALLGSGEMLNAVLRVEGSASVPSSFSHLVSVREVKSQQGEAIEEQKPTSPVLEKVDLDFQLMPSLPWESEDTRELEEALKKHVKSFDDSSRKDETHIEFQVGPENLEVALYQVGLMGLLRFTGVSKLDGKSLLRVRIRIQEPDEVMKDASDVAADEFVEGVYRPFGTELDMLYSGGGGNSGRWVSSVDLTFRQWVRTFGLRVHYVETLGATYDDYTRVTSGALQYRYSWKKARYGQSLVPSLIFKNIRTSGPTNNFYGLGFAYTDNMWKSVEWVFNILPFFRRPKTVELNLEYLPFSASRGGGSPTVGVLSLKGFVHRSPRLNLIGAFYYHYYRFSATDEVDGVRISSSSAVNTALSIQFGLGYRF